MQFPKELPGEGFIHSWYPIVFALIIGVLYAIRSYFKGTQCLSKENMKGKTVIVTGSNRGIGKETVRLMALRDAKVIMACRNEESAKEAIVDIKDRDKTANVRYMHLDLTSLQSVEEFAKKFLAEEEKLDVLVNNAAVMCHPKSRTKDGLELHLATNYVGHVYLTDLLLDKLKESSGRILNVVAPAYQLGEIRYDDINFDKMSDDDFKSGDAYSQSKLAMMLHTLEMSKRLEGTGVCINSVYPGISNTDLYQLMPFKQSTIVSVTFAPICWMIMKRAADGAQCILYCAMCKQEDGVSGKYFAECEMKDCDQVAKDADNAKKCYEFTQKLIKSAVAKREQE